MQCQLPLKATSVLTRHILSGRISFKNGPAQVTSCAMLDILAQEATIAVSIPVVRMDTPARRLAYVTVIQCKLLSLLQGNGYFEIKSNPILTLITHTGPRFATQVRCILRRMSPRLHTGPPPRPTTLRGRLGQPSQRHQAVAPRRPRPGSPFRGLASAMWSPTPARLPGVLVRQQSRHRCLISTNRWQTRRTKLFAACPGLSVLRSACIMCLLSVTTRAYTTALTIPPPTPPQPSPAAPPTTRQRPPSRPFLRPASPRQ